MKDLLISKVAWRGLSDSCLIKIKVLLGKHFSVTLRRN